MRLAKRLGLRTKAGVVRLAVDELERRVARDQIWAAIREYVRKHGRLDRQENASLGRAWPETIREDSPRARLCRRFQRIGHITA